MKNFYQLSALWRWLLIGLATVGIGALTYLIFPRSDPAKEFEKFTATVEQLDADIRITSAGQVAPNRKVNVGPKEAGLLTNLYVEQGQAVRQGQVLARMDTSRGVHEVAEAKAAVDLAHARYLEARNGPRSQDIAQAEANRRSAWASLTIAQNNYDRFKRLHDDKVINDIDFNSRRLELERAREAFKESEEKLSLLKAGSRYEQVLAAKAELERSEASLADARTRLSDLTIHAPFTGIVSQRYAQAGSFVSPTTDTQGDSANSSSILLLIDRLEVLATVAESDIARIQVGQPVSITTSAFPGQTFKGKVRLVAPEAVQENEITQFQVRVLLEDRAARTLKSRMNVTVNFIAGRLKDALIVPTTAIISKDGKTGVLVPDPNKGPTFQEVTPGQSLGDKTQIVSGLRSGEKIFSKLPPNLKIEDVLGESNAFR
jgi:HlyD family secretion protein